MSLNPDLFTSVYKPDVLSCFADLSNDEVFTPPDVANKMLDMLPQELFRDPNTKFLDPACKSGVFLREIAKRLRLSVKCWGIHPTSLLWHQSYVWLVPFFLLKSRIRTLNLPKWRSP